MAFQDLSATIILFLVLSVLFQLIPISLIGIGGILCLRKGYKLSGTLLLLSLAPSLVNHIGTWWFARLATDSGTFGMLAMAYVSPVSGFLGNLGNLLVASAVLTLIRTVGQRDRALSIPE